MAETLTPLQQLLQRLAHLEGRTDRFMVIGGVEAQLLIDTIARLEHLVPHTQQAQREEDAGRVEAAALDAYDDEPGLTYAQRQANARDLAFWREVAAKMKRGEP